MHLLNNLFFLVVFGTILERMIGSRRFLAIFLAGGLVANLTGFLYYQQSSLLGASGAISAVIAALAVFQPRKPGLFWGVPVPMWVALLGWIGTNSVGATATGTGIAFEAHLFGLGFGSLMGLYLRYRRPDAVRTEETGSVEIDERTLREWERRYMRD